MTDGATGCCQLRLLRKARKQTIPWKAAPIRSITCEAPLVRGMPTSKSAVGTRRTNARSAASSTQGTDCCDFIEACMTSLPTENRDRAGPEHSLERKGPGVSEGRERSRAYTPVITLARHLKYGSKACPRPKFRAEVLFPLANGLTI